MRKLESTLRPQSASFTAQCALLKTSSGHPRLYVAVEVEGALLACQEANFLHCYNFAQQHLSLRTCTLVLHNPMNSGFHLVDLLW